MSMITAKPENDDLIFADDASTPKGQRAAASRNPHVLTLPVELTVTIGKARLTIDQLLAVDEETIITLDAKIDDPVSLLVGERLVARGALVETQGDQPGLGVRITEVFRDAAAK